MYLLTPTTARAKNKSDIIKVGKINMISGKIASNMCFPGTIAHKQFETFSPVLLYFFIPHSMHHATFAKLLVTNFMVYFTSSNEYYNKTS